MKAVKSVAKRHRNYFEKKGRMIYNRIGEIMNNKVKVVPYGLSSFERLVEKNCYYVDKTPFLETIEKSSDYLFMIRPRRFGKSLCLSMMETYYDVLYKDRFDHLFQGTYIHRRPTEERNSFLVLKFNFSQVDPAVDRVEASFLHHVRSSAIDFVEKYAEYLPKGKGGGYFRDTIEKSNSPADILSSLSALCRRIRQKLYVIIDEYDNFANTILSTTGQEAYKELTHGVGSFKSFFSTLKGGTDGTAAPFQRLFLTGVSPITLDDVTSGYNIGDNVSLDAAFNRMMGFTADETREMLEYYRAAGLIAHNVPDVMDIFNRWYGNYVFSKHAPPGEKLFNPDMVLYFLREYFKIGEIPEHLVDRNVRMDYGKLKHLIIVNRLEEKSTKSTKSTNGNFDRLKEIIEKKETLSGLKEAFPMEKLAHKDNFISLLFYFGLLTIKGIDAGDLVLAVPNETVQRLYYDYIKEGYEESGVFSLDLHRYHGLMKAMAMEGKWRPLFDYLAGRMRESMNLRDLITGEKSIQAFLTVYLGLSQLYILHGEKELNKGFADILLEPFRARYAEIGYSYLLEIKYLKAGEKPSQQVLNKLREQSVRQLEQYGLDGNLAKVTEKTTLVKLSLIFSGPDLISIHRVN